MSELRRGVATIDVRMLGTGGFEVARAVQQSIAELKHYQPLAVALG
jgi:hypothetical protein